MRVAYFTAGTTGVGHFVRGLAIRRALARASFAGEYRSFGPALPYRGLPLEGHQAVFIDHEVLCDPARAQDSDLARALEAYAPDLVIADVFWAPLRHLTLRCEAWLLVRKCPPVWFVGPSDRLRFDASRFARILAIEPHLAQTPATEEVEPVVVANPRECRPPSALRERFNVAPGARLDVVLHAGRAGERARLSTTAHGGHVVLDLWEEDALFPAAEWLGGADGIVCGAGYNSFWEAHWLGYADRTRFAPFERPIDDQAWRIRTCSGHVMKENGADAIARRVMAGGG